MENNNNGVAKLSKVDVLKNMLAAESVQEQFKNGLQESKDTFIASLIELYSGDTYLQNCEPKLVVMEALKAAVLKLPIIKSLGFAYIIPYKKNNVLVPQFQIGYKGLIQLAMRTAQYRIINADVVLEGEYRAKKKLTGEFDLSGDAKSETIIGYFAHFEMLNGFSKTLYMTKEKVTAHAQKYSKSYNTAGTPWKTEFDAMATKTVVRNLLTHWGFLSVEMMQSMNDDDMDVSEKVREHIAVNANRKDMSFENVNEAELAEKGYEEYDTNNAGGPGF